jgi:hypothetical protein
MRLLDGMPYTPSVATNIRETFARISEADDWRCRLEGARQVMRTFGGETHTTNVMPLRARNAKS